MKRGVAAFLAGLVLGIRGIPWFMHLGYLAVIVYLLRHHK